MHIYKAHFGRILEQILRDRGIKQYELAHFIGIEAPNVSRWVKGVNFPEDAHFEKICKFLGVDESVFLGENSEKSDLIVAIVSALPALDEGQLRRLLSTATNLSSGPATPSARKAPLSK